MAAAPAALREKRAIGATGVCVSPLGFGCSPLGNEFGVIDEQRGIDAVHEAVRVGVNYFDVSPYYGRGRAETVLGKALAALPRDSFVVSTKVGRYDVDRFDFSAERVAKSVDESLARLGLDTLDMVLCHDIEFARDLDQIASETLPALQRLKHAGKVRAVGITAYPLEVFPYVLATAAPRSVDVVLSYCNYTLQCQRLERLAPALRRERVALINASPLCMGLLTAGGPPAWHPASDRVKAAARQASDVCEQRGVPLAELAVKYALDYDAVASTLVGVGDRDILMKNVRAVGARPDAQLVESVRSIMATGGALNERWKSGRFDG